MRNKFHIYLLYLADWLDASDILPETIRGTLDLSKSSLKEIHHTKFIDGSLFMRNSNVVRLSNLTTVTGDLDCAYSAIQDLGELSTVGGTLNVSYNNSIKWDHIEHVGEFLIILQTNITLLPPSLIHVGKAVLCNSLFQRNELIMNHGNKFRYRTM